MKILRLGIKEYPYGISAHYEKYPGGGIAKHVIPLSERLSGEGIEHFIITRRMAGQKTYELCNNVHVYRVFWINNVILRLPSFILFSFFRALTIAGTVHIIHAHGFISFIPAIILSKLSRKKVVGTLHGGPFSKVTKYPRFIVGIARFIEKTSITLMREIIFISHDEKERITKTYKLKGISSTLIYNGIAPLDATKKSVSQTFQVIFIGRLVQRKGIDKLITAYSLIEKNIRKNIKILIVGDGYYRKELEILAAAIGFPNNIAFVGFQKSIEKYLAESDLLILPSEGSEGLPTVLLEAMSTGIPALVSNFKLNLEEDILLCLPNNQPETIASNIVYYFENRRELNMIGKKAKDIFEKHFTLQKYFTNYKEFYSKLVA